MTRQKALLTPRQFGDLVASNHKALLTPRKFGCLDTSDHMALLDYLQYLDGADDIDGIVERFKFVFGNYGYSAGMIAWTNPDEPGGFTFDLNMWGPEVRASCESLRAGGRSPDVIQCHRSPIPFWGSDLKHGFDWAPEQLASFDAKKSAGQWDYLTVPINKGRCLEGVICLAGDRNMYKSGAAAIGQTLAYATTGALKRIRNAISVPPARDVLSRREKECLSWASVGKTDWEVGEILSISGNTVHTHIENAKRKLGTTTRVHAIVTAIQQGMISI